MPSPSGTPRHERATMATSPQPDHLLDALEALRYARDVAQGNIDTLRALWSCGAADEQTVCRRMAQEIDRRDRCERAIRRIEQPREG